QIGPYLMQGGGGLKASPAALAVVIAEDADEIRHGLPAIGQARCAAEGRGRAMVPAVLDRGDGEGLVEIRLIADEVAPALLGEIAHEDRVGIILVVEGKGRLRIAGRESGELDESAAQRRARG